jgi:soluble lytic murein transglycosylase-like protein
MEKNYTVNAKLKECDSIARFPESIKKYCFHILTAAQENNLDPVLIAAVIFQESGGDESAVSRSGAIGLMQVMPRDGKANTFMCKNGPCFADRPSGEELLEPTYNISYGSHLLADLIQWMGGLREGLKSYGPLHMDYLYADRIVSIMEQYR